MNKFLTMLLTILIIIINGTATNRMYAPGKPKNLKKSMLILSSGSNDVYDVAIYEYEKTFDEYLGLENLGIFKAFDGRNKSDKILSQLREAGQNLQGGYNYENHERRSI